MEAGTTPATEPRFNRHIVRYFCQKNTAVGRTFVAGGALAAVKIAPWPAAVFGILLAARTFWLLGRRPKFPAKVVGYTELILGLAMALTVAAACRLF